jgi:hypothetical protein
MSLVPETSKPSFHRGSFVDELESARTDLAYKLSTGLSPTDTPAESPSTSSSESAPALSPTTSATPSTPPSAPISPSNVPVNEDLVADSFAFAFDIDGVLIRGGRAIPEAIEAMQVLNGKNEYGIKM